MAKKSHKKIDFKIKLKNVLKRLILLTTILFFLSLAFILIFQVVFLNKIYPGIYINNISLMGHDFKSAQQKILNTLIDRSREKLIFTHQQQKLELDLKDIKNDLLNNEGQISFALNQAFEMGRRRFYFKAIYLKTSFDKTPELDRQISKLSQNFNQAAIDAQLKIEGEQISVTPSQEGIVIDQQLLKQKTIEYLQTGYLKKETLPTKASFPKFDYTKALTIKNILDRLKTSPKTLKFKEKVFKLTYIDLVEMLDITNSSHPLGLNQDKLDKFLADISLQINQEVKEPLLNLDPSSTTNIKVKEFQPPQQGRKLNLELTSQKITEGLVSFAKEVELVVDTQEPKNKLVNDLGIKELIGSGVSHFKGSIANRIYNINLATSRINGSLIAPGEVFSFVDTIGDISASTGYKQAYVIKSGRTILDDGGGVCQVSTTFFRAALNSGLPILERVAHAYRVGYYEQGFPPGLDATIFHPTVDLKVKNDTKFHILIQAYTQGASLYINFYGTSDGKTSEVSKPIISNSTPPPPEVRQDDPNLPKGEIKQVEYPAYGANVVFSRIVKKDGQEIINEKFYSNYRPWAAVYLVGTKE